MLTFYVSVNSVCHMSCELECSGAGPKGCAKCKSGWSHDLEIGCKGVCVGNECKHFMPSCLVVNRQSIISIFKEMGISFFDTLKK